MVDLETRTLAAFIGKITLGVRDVLEQTHPERFEIGRGAPHPGDHPHVLRLTEPLDCTGAALVAEELNRAFEHDSRHVHRPTPTEGDGPQIVYLAWTGPPYPGTQLPRRR
ncbi:MAG TPA: hypothetical protein VJB14_04970 [Planctomycetota bacterium]|nr:hypothetical protein [Planctomycetota bacterium]